MPFLLNKTRNPGGATNVPEATPLCDFGQYNPFTYHWWEEDFERFLAADWLVSGGGTTPQPSGANNNGGIAQMVNTAANGNEQSMQWAGQSGSASLGYSWTGAGGKNQDFFFYAAMQTDNVTLDSIFCGMASSQVAPITTPPTDGMWFTAPANGQLSAVVSVASVTTTLAAAAGLPSVVPSGYNTFGFAFTYANGAFRAWFNGAAYTFPVGTLPPTNPVGVSFSHKNGSAAARTLSIDYFLAALGNPTLYVGR
jgi:hypothetical protein